MDENMIKTVIRETLLVYLIMCYTHWPKRPEAMCEIYK